MLLLMDSFGVLVVVGIVVLRVSFGGMSQLVVIECHLTCVLFVEFV